MLHIYIKIKKITGYKQYKAAVLILTKSFNIKEDNNKRRGPEKKEQAKEPRALERPNQNTTQHMSGGTWSVSHKVPLCMFSSVFGQVPRKFLYM